MSLKEPTQLEWDDRLTEADKKLVGELNAALDRLSGLRAVEINVSGKFARSKIAWKLATYQHALLHRLVALMDGAADPRGTGASAPGGTHIGVPR
jgi:hypothetical protein